MSLRNRIRTEDKRLRSEALNEEQRIVEDIRTDPVRARATTLIRQVEPLLYEFAKTTGTHLKKETTYEERSFKTPLASFGIYRSKVSRGWFTYNYFDNIMSVQIGHTTVSRYGEKKVETTLLRVSSYGRSYEDHNSATYDSVPADGPPFKEWFSDILMKIYEELRARGVAEYIFGHLKN